MSAARGAIFACAKERTVSRNMIDVGAEAEIEARQAVEDHRALNPGSRRHDGVGNDSGWTVACQRRRQR